MSTPYTLSDYLNAINKTKADLFEQALDDEAVRGYTQFIINRCLAAHHDCIMFVNEVNCLETPLEDKDHFDFFRTVLSARSRFSKMPKPEKLERIELLVKLNICSRRLAIEFADILTDAQVNRLRIISDPGGLKK